MVKILGKAKQAQTPDRFTADFLETKLGFRGGNSRQFIPFAKKLGLLRSDGTPTDLYKKFRNSSTSKAAMAQALRQGYREAFERNEGADRLGREEFKGLVLEITGLDAKDRVAQLICQTFEALKPLADFGKQLPGEAADVPELPPQPLAEDEQPSGVDLGLSYTINLVLPKTDDPAVFNAIFRSLRDNLLRR